MGNHTGRKILAAVKKNRYLTAAAVFRDQLLKKWRVSKSTIERFLNSAGLKVRYKRKLVKMTVEHAKTRLFYCNQVAKWGNR
jgi:hypothetical protein